MQHSKNMNRIFITLFLLPSMYAFAQVNENFSDNELTENPPWILSDPLHWTVENQRLKSASTVASSFFQIVTASQPNQGAQWEIDVQLDFLTSANNYVDVYLTSTEQNLISVSNSGYFVRIGDSADEISLFKKKPNVSTPVKIIDGKDKSTDKNSNNVYIKVIRDANNVWTLERDTTVLKNKPHIEGSVTDNEITTSNFFGLLVRQSTTSFHGKHFFDNIYVGPIILDTAPPEISNITVVDAKTISIQFSEKVNQTLAENESRYTLNETTPPTQVILLQDKKTVTCTFANAFPNDATSTITISGLQDLAGNEATSLSKTFYFLQPDNADLYDVVLTECMPDPSPTIALPDAEWVELHNRSNKIFNLKNWKISDGTTTGNLGEYILRPGNYVILLSSSNVSSFSNLPVIGVSNFPTLNNAEETLFLQDDQQNLLDKLSYSSTWYKDEDKASGGWSLERIDINNVCADEENWKASEAAPGGTPGAINSVKNSLPDQLPPVLLDVFAASENTIQITVNEKLEATIPSQSNFSVSPNVEISSVNFTDERLKGLTLQTTENLDSEGLYTLNISSLTDCAGNTSKSVETQFALPQPPENGDIIINEILFNPQVGGVDFVELWNTSNKFINLQNWKIANEKEGEPDELKTIITQNKIIKPNDYIVLTENTETLRTQYPLSNHLSFITVDLPPMPDESGILILMNDAEEIQEKISYHEDWHNPLLRETEGVSLERTHPQNDGLSQQSWQSGVQASGYASPGLANANYLEKSSQAEQIKIEPEIFQPLRGNPAFTTIRYVLNRNGLTAKAEIYDYEGRLIKTIANQQTLANAGSWVWHGDQNDGTKARDGFYTLFVQLFDTSGFVKTLRKRIVIASP
jgi:hypothetical protein